MFGVPHSETEFNSFTTTFWGSNTRHHMDCTVGGTCTKPNWSVYAPYVIPSMKLQLIKREGRCSVNGRYTRFTESCVAQFSVTMFRFMFRFIMGIMTGLFGRSLCSILGLRANNYVKTLTSTGFLLHHSPLAIGCFTNNARVAPVIIP